MPPRRTYIPERIEESRQRARRGDAIIRPLAAYAQIEYRCKRCDATYMGDEAHICKKGPVGRP